MTAPRLIHYGREYLTTVRSVPQNGDLDFVAGKKPDGLWVSVEGERDWREFCLENDFGCLDRATEVVLAPDARVLRLRSAAELDEFHRRYSVDWTLIGRPREMIRWADVAARWRGVIIAPYVYSRRLRPPVSDWYYGWDCASGCLWDADAVAELRPLPPTVVRKIEKEETA